MNIDRIQEAADAVNWLSSQAELAGKAGDDACVPFATLPMIARSYLLEYAHHVLVAGKEPYDAMLATARAQLPVSQAAWDLMAALRPPRAKG